MHDRVEAAKVTLGALEHARDLGIGPDVARVERRAGERGRQLLHVLLEPLTLVGERQPHPGAGQRLGDGPGDRALVRHTQHDAGLALEKRHRQPRRSSCGPVSGGVTMLAAIRYSPAANLSGLSAATMSTSWYFPDRKSTRLNS